METPKALSYAAERSMLSQGPLRLGDLASPAPTASPDTYSAAPEGSRNDIAGRGTLRMDTPVTVGRSNATRANPADTLVAEDRGPFVPRTTFPSAAEYADSNIVEGEEAATAAKQEEKKKKKKKKKEKKKEKSEIGGGSGGGACEPFPGESRQAALDLVNATQQMLSLGAIPIPELPDVSSDEEEVEQEEAEVDAHSRSLSEVSAPQKAIAALSANRHRRRLQVVARLGYPSTSGCTRKKSAAAGSRLVAWARRWASTLKTRTAAAAAAPMSAPGISGSWSADKISSAKWRVWRENWIAWTPKQPRRRQG